MRVVSVDCSYFLVGCMCFSVGRSYFSVVDYTLAFLEHCIAALVVPPWVVWACNKLALVLACVVPLALPCMLAALEDCIWVVHTKVLVQHT